MNFQKKTKNNYLPNTYQQYLAKKKQSRHNISTIQSIQVTPAIQKPSINIKKATKQDEFQDIQVKNIKLTEKIVSSQYMKMLEQRNDCKFAARRNKIKQEIQDLKANGKLQIKTTGEIMRQMNLQSFENIKKIQEELKKPIGKKNLQQMDNALSFNNFFSGFTKEKRYKVYENCQLIIVKDKEYVFKVGQLDDYMYIIIKGCVLQFQPRQTSFHQKINANFINLYEGSIFGESLILQGNNYLTKRYCCVIALQTSYLLRISNNFYRELITSSKQDDFQRKIESLLSTTLFGNTSKIYLIPLLSCIEKETLQYGKVLIKQGDPVRKIYIIAQGSLQIVYIQRLRRKLKHLNIEPKPQNIYVKKSSNLNKATKSQSIHQNFYFPKDLKDKKQFVFGSKKIIGDQIQYSDQIILAQLRPGDFIGGKNFLSQIDIENKKSIDPKFNANIQSRVSVISTNIASVVYSLDQKKFISLSQNLQRLIRKGIVESVYFDQFDIQEKANFKKQWKKYSENLTKSVIDQKKQRTSNFRD